MLILYPHASSSGWTISPRVAHGHNMPFVSNPSCDTSPLVFLPDLSLSPPSPQEAQSKTTTLDQANTSGEGRTVVSFLRPLDFGDDQKSLWTEGGRWVDWSERQGDARVVWAWGEAGPSGGSLTELIGIQ